MSETVQDVQDRVQREGAAIEQLLGEVRRVIVGQKYLLERMVIGLLTRGHLLLEGVPGLAKTLAVRSLAGAVHGVSGGSVPPDLPADLTGTLIYNQDGTFVPRKGPFARLRAADEINRAPPRSKRAPRVDAERRVTIGDTTYPSRHRFVLATQIRSSRGDLPARDPSRPLLGLHVDYPSSDEDGDPDRMTGPRSRTGRRPKTSSAPHCDALDLRRRSHRLRGQLVRPHADRRTSSSISGLVQYRRRRAPRWPSSPRAGTCVPRGRGFVSPEDIKAVGHDVMRHRLILSFEAEAESITSDEVVQRVFDAVEVP
jgi:MoxR-like ATPase